MLWDKLKNKSNSKKSKKNMNYKKIIDALIVINKNSKKIDGLPPINFDKISKKIRWSLAPSFFDENQNIEYRLKSLYSIKDLVIAKLIAHGQLKGDTFHQFSRGGFSLSLRSKFAKKDDLGKVIGEFHNGCKNTPTLFKKLKYDGILKSHQDKEKGFYKAKIDLAQALYIVSKFLDATSITKTKKNLAIAKRKGYFY